MQPVWVGWSSPHLNAEASYSFVAPTGAYDVETVTFPRLGTSFQRPALDNIGSGLWTHQFQGGAAVFPFDTKATAIAASLSYALHGEREDLNVTPGSSLGLDWAITQYIPITTPDLWVVSVGPSGLDQWQVTDDTGSGAVDPNEHSQVHAAGGELGVGYVPWKTEVWARYTHDFAAKSRFEGQTVTLAIGTRL